MILSEVDCSVKISVWRCGIRKGYSRKFGSESIPLRNKGQEREEIQKKGSDRVAK